MGKMVSTSPRAKLLRYHPKLPKAGDASTEAVLGPTGLTGGFNLSSGYGR